MGGLARGLARASPRASLGKVVARYDNLERGSWQGLACLGRVRARGGTSGTLPGMSWTSPGLLRTCSGLAQDLPGQVREHPKNFTPYSKFDPHFAFEFFLLHVVILIPPYMWGCPGAGDAVRGGRLRAHKPELAKNS